MLFSGPLAMPLAAAPSSPRNMRDVWDVQVTPSGYEPSSSISLGGVIHVYSRFASKQNLEGGQNPDRTMAHSLQHRQAARRVGLAETKALFESVNRRRGDAGLAPLVIPSAVKIRRRLDLADPYYVYAKRHGTAAANARFTLFENGPDVGPLNKWPL